MQHEKGSPEESRKEQQNLASITTLVRISKTSHAIVGTSSAMEVENSTHGGT